MRQTRFLLVILGVLLSVTWATGAQDATPTPRPTLAIDLFNATPTPVPLNNGQRIEALVSIALQQDELPGSGLLNTASLENGTHTIETLGALWAEIRPKLQIAYNNNGVLAVNFATFFAANCSQVPVYGLGSEILVFPDNISAQGFIVDNTVTTLYQEYFGLQRIATTLPGGSLYHSTAPHDLCPQGANYYRFEYAYGVYVVAIKVYTVNDVTLANIETIITSLRDVLNSRIDQIEGTSQQLSTPAVIQPPATATSDVIRNIYLTPEPVIGTAQAFFLQDTGLIPFSETGGVVNPTLVVRNPAQPNRYALTDNIGLLFVMDRGQPARINVTPFNDFIPPVRTQNDDLVTEAVWSPDGQYLAFVIDSTGNETRSPDAGVWYFQPGAFPPLQLLIDCPPGCEIVTRFDDPREYTAKSAVWAPDSMYLMVNIYIPATERNGLIMFQRATAGEGIRNIRPPVLNFDYGDWANDGRIVVSGRTGENGDVLLGLVNRDGTGLQVVFDAGAQGLWMQNATQRPDDNKPYSGEIIALGRQGDGNGAMWLYTQDGTKITELTIGQTRPVTVRWNRDRSAVYVATQEGRKFIARIDGSITEVTAQIGGVEAVGWDTGWLPPTPNVDNN